MRPEIPGYDDAVTQEQLERSEAYLDLYEEVCGHKIRQMTPLDLCKLDQAKSPFVHGGAFAFAHVAQFLCILSTDPKATSKAGIQKSFKALGSYTLEDCEREIANYLQVTFRDQPEGGSSSEAPIACSAAWLEYRMRCEPFRWDRQVTLNTPIRVIYQQIRCWYKDQGEDVPNKLSRGIKCEWLKSINERMKRGELTQADIDAANLEWLKNKVKMQRN